MRRRFAYTLTIAMACASIGNADLSNKAPSSQHDAVQTSRARIEYGAIRALDRSDRQLAQHLSWALLNSSSQASETQRALQIMDATDRAFPWRSNLGFALLPSQNIFSAANDTHMDLWGQRAQIIGGGDPKFGIGARVVGQVSYRFVAAPGMRIIPSAEIAWVGYRDYDILNRWQIEPELALEWAMPQVKVEARAFMAANLYTEADSDRRAGVELAADYFVRPDITVSMRAQYGQVAFQSRSYLDGDQSKLDARVQQTINQNLSFSLGGGIARRNAQGMHHGFDSAHLEASLNVTASVSDMFDLSLRTEARAHKAEIPGLGMLRQDQDISLSVGWTNRRINVYGAAPRIGCELSENRSNVPLFSTRHTNCALSLHAQF